MKKYDVTVHFKYDLEDERSEDFKLETDDMDSAKQFIKERDASIVLIILSSRRKKMKKNMNTIIHQTNPILLTTARYS